MDYSRPISTTNNITLDLPIYRPEKPKGAIFSQVIFSAFDGVETDKSPSSPGGTDAGADLLEAVDRNKNATVFRGEGFTRRCE